MFQCFSGRWRKHGYSHAMAKHRCLLRARAATRVEEQNLIREVLLKLSLYSDHAMRVMIHLAIKDERLVSIREVAAVYDISQNHLMKVVQDLASAGYIEAVRGRNGGLRLARPADQVSLGSILRHTEKLSNSGLCERQIDVRACGLPTILRDAVASFIAVFDRYSLADIAKKNSDLVELLRMAPANESRGFPASALLKTNSHFPGDQYD